MQQFKVSERAKEEAKSLRQFGVGDSVWFKQPGIINTKLSKPLLGPFMVSICHSNVTYELLE